MKNLIGEKIKALRIERNWSQEHLADLLFISQSAYARMENGQSNAWAVHLERICTVFSITLEEFLFDSKAEEIKSVDVKNEEFIYFFIQKLETQYEARIKEKDQTISDLRELIRVLTIQLKP
ncbi:helix-turn-helix transcriptional regulator [Flavobacterium sp. 20NA77.7]|uniref:Helix-turn-helix transcriptional regulator n=1 Tax=Flavobacterium nakdongensis TaxID=3073563 RepID=A0ABY9RA59_9FLAO|nr:helix-turn-helix transcriptional regulator [Flavobacterium sp. 20NA77.7]WMW77836.1 helix-turn-helix transcriptional regulator [Flavobacterium sp. 20NA77.7]